MGKGEIISGGTAGLYRVKEKLHITRIAATIAKITADIESLQPQITQIDIQIAAKQSEVSIAEAAVAALIKEDPKKNAAAIVTAQTTVMNKKAEYLALRGQKSFLEIQQKGMEMRIAYLVNNTPAEKEYDAWCADLTEDLEGVVGTIEIPGEVGTVMIQPGYEGNAEYDSGRDGQLQPIIAATPESTFFNLALLPGWQKWTPTYRTGQITSLTGNMCSVQSMMRSVPLKVSQSIKEPSYRMFPSNICPAMEGLFLLATMY